MTRGKLISVEGIDGVGKTTHAALLLERLRACGTGVISFREPGGTPLGEQLRALLKATAERTPLSELLLFATARAELVQTRIKPALAEGTWVLLDRFSDSTCAYQGALGGIAEDVLEQVCRIAADGLEPDLTFWLDAGPGPPWGAAIRWPGRWRRAGRRRRWTLSSAATRATSPACASATRDCTRWSRSASCAWTPAGRWSRRRR